MVRRQHKQTDVRHHRYEEIVNDFLPGMSTAPAGDVTKKRAGWGALFTKSSRADGQRTVTGGGNGGTEVGWVPGRLGAGPADGPGTGAAEAVVVAPGGGPPGNTTTRVPTLTRSNRSETSSFSMPIQPEETNLPIVDGWLVPWMR